MFILPPVTNKWNFGLILSQIFRSSVRNYFYWVCIFDNRTSRFVSKEFYWSTFSLSFITILWQKSNSQSCFPKFGSTIFLVCVWLGVASQIIKQYILTKKTLIGEGYYCASSWLRGKKSMMFQPWHAKVRHLPRKGRYAYYVELHNEVLVI